MFRPSNTTLPPQGPHHLRPSNNHPRHHDDASIVRPSNTTPPPRGWHHRPSPLTPPRHYQEAIIFRPRPQARQHNDGMSIKSLDRHLGTTSTLSSSGVPPPLRRHPYTLLNCWHGNDMRPVCAHRMDSPRLNAHETMPPMGCWSRNELHEMGAHVWFPRRTGAGGHAGLTGRRSAHGHRQTRACLISAVRRPQ